MIEQNKTAASESSTNLAWNKPRARPFGSGHCLWDPSRKWRVWTLLLCWPSRGGPSQAHWLGQWVLTGSTWYVVREIQARGQGFSPSALSAVWAKWLLFVEAVLCVVGCLAEFLGTRGHPSPLPHFYNQKCLHTFHPLLRTTATGEQSSVSGIVSKRFSSRYWKEKLYTCLSRRIT